MTALVTFFRAWLVVCFVLVFFLVPFYLVAIYPEVPEPYIRVMRGYGVVRGATSELGFWYRFSACGIQVLIGLLIAAKWIGYKSAEKAEPSRK